MVRFCRTAGTLLGWGTWYRPVLHVHDLELVGLVCLRYAGRSFLDWRNAQRVQYAQLRCSAQNLRSLAVSVNTRLLVVERVGTLKARRNSPFRVARLRRRSERWPALVSLSWRILVERRITREGRCSQYLSLDSLVYLGRGISEKRIKGTRCTTFARSTKIHIRQPITPTLNIKCVLCRQHDRVLPLRQNGREIFAKSDFSHWNKTNMPLWLPCYLRLHTSSALRAS